ncbi:MAG: CPBP family glutamic-type intramembrane protease [Chloroflexi bacterium]|nr:CPBP family glutamic-type intramembrane protease [Chloroflexota bacterium]
MRCPRCNGLIDRGARFCPRCGEPLAGGLSARDTIANPFMILKTRWVFPWAVLGFMLAAVVLVIASMDSDDEPTDPALFLIVLNVLFGAIAVWMFLSFRSKGIDIRRLIGRLPQNYNWFPVIGILLVNMVFSLGSVIVVGALIASASEPVARSLETEPIIPNTPNPTLLIASIATVAVLAPVFEELFFRGVLINRWAVKWRLGIAIVASALLFGILHLIAIGGAFMFGTIAALLYIRTRTLLVPMAMHVVNNSLVTLAVLARPAEDGQAAASTASAVDVPTTVFGLALLVITLPILVWYLRKNWPRRDEPPPYEASGVEPSPVQAASL